MKKNLRRENYSHSDKNSQSRSRVGEVEEFISCFAKSKACFGCRNVLCSMNLGAKVQLCLGLVFGLKGQFASFNWKAAVYINSVNFKFCDRKFHLFMEFDSIQDSFNVLAFK